jgi:hypothetical protein
MIECVAWFANIEPIFKAASFFKKLGGVLFHNEPIFFMSPQHDGEVKNGSESRDDKAQYDRRQGV